MKLRVVPEELTGELLDLYYATEASSNWEGSYARMQRAAQEFIELRGRGKRWGQGAVALDLLTLTIQVEQATKRLLK